MVGRTSAGVAEWRRMALRGGRRDGGIGVGNLNLTIRKGRRVVDEWQEHREVSDSPMIGLVGGMESFLMVMD